MKRLHDVLIGLYFGSLLAALWMIAAELSKANDHLKRFGPELVTIQLAQPPAAVTHKSGLPPAPWAKVPKR